MLTMMKETSGNGTALKTASVKDSILLINKVLASNGLSKAVFSRDQWQDLGKLARYLDTREERLRNYLELAVGGCSLPCTDFKTMVMRSQSARAEAKAVFLGAAPQIAGQIMDSGRPLNDAEVKKFISAAEPLLGELLASALGPKSIGRGGELLDAEVANALGSAQKAGLLTEIGKIVEAVQANEKIGFAYEEKKQVEFMGIH